MLYEYKEAHGFFLNFDFFGCFNDEMVSFDSESDTGQLFHLRVSPTRIHLLIFSEQKKMKIYISGFWMVLLDLYSSNSKLQSN